MPNRLELDAIYSKVKPHEALLWKPLGSGNGNGAKLQCQLCSFYCVLGDGEYGNCLARVNRGGKLYTMNYERNAGMAIDPIEKKPFFHFKPGTRVLSFGAPACNFRCLNCQNWDLSQSAIANPMRILPIITAKDVAKTAIKTRCDQIFRSAHSENSRNSSANSILRCCDGISYTYSEPTIFFEYARDCVLETRKIENGAKLFHLFVSNGYFSKEMLSMVENENLLQAIRIDLKFIDEDKYFKITGGHLKPVLDNITRMCGLKKKGKMHTEIICLVIPGLNDSEDDFRRVAQFMKGVDASIPLHFSRFFPGYHLANLPPTDLSKLLLAKKIAEDEGIEYVYIGNTNLKDVENTYCPKCKSLLVEREGFSVRKNILKGDGCCPNCGKKQNFVL